MSELKQTIDSPEFMQMFQRSAKPGAPKAGGVKGGRKADTTHTIISMYEDEVRRVQCVVCGEVHAKAAPSVKRRNFAGCTDTIALPPRTTSIKRWATLLEEHARSAAIAEESGHWLADARRRARRLPVDHPAAQNLESSAKVISVSLSPEETESLLRDAPAAYGTQINDLLLAAFALALRTFTGSDAVLFDLEGHGREEIFPGVDLTRTVGWFTTLFPVVLDLGGDDDPGRVLKSVKEQLRAVPRRGIGYGLLRYLRGDEALRRELAALPQPQIIFNYLGQVGQAVPEAAPLRAARESSGPAHSPRAQRTHLLEVIANVAGGKLQVQLTYGELVHERASVNALAERFLGALRALIDHCLSPGAGGYTASDFRAGALPQHVVDRLAALGALPEDEEHRSLASRKNLEDVYPLSPMQEGMLFHTVYAHGDGVYAGLRRLLRDPFGQLLTLGVIAVATLPFDGQGYPDTMAWRIGVALGLALVAGLLVFID